MISDQPLIVGEKAAQIDSRQQVGQTKGSSAAGIGNPIDHKSRTYDPASRQNTDDQSKSVLSSGTG